MLFFHRKRKQKKTRTYTKRTHPARLVDGTCCVNAVVPRTLFLFCHSGLLLVVVLDLPHVSFVLKKYKQRNKDTGYKSIPPPTIPVLHSVTLSLDVDAAGVFVCVCVESPPPSCLFIPFFV